MKLRSGLGPAPPLAGSINGIAVRDHVGHLSLTARFASDANFLLMAALGIRSGGRDCTGQLDPDLVRSALRHGADANLVGYANCNVIYLASCRTVQCAHPNYNAINTARAEEIVIMLIEAGADLHLADKMCQGQLLVYDLIRRIASC